MATIAADGALSINCGKLFKSELLTEFLEIFISDSPSNSPNE